MRIKKQHKTLSHPTQNTLVNQELDKCLNTHNQTVMKNKQEHLTIQYCRQFYNKLVVNGEKINRTDIHELEEIPADSFMTLCSQFKKLTIHHRKDPEGLKVDQVLNQCISKKDEITVNTEEDEEKKRLKRREDDFRFLNLKKTATSNDLRKLCLKKKRQLLEMRQAREELKLERWTSIDQRIERHKRDSQKFADNRIVRGQSVELVLLVFQDTVAIVQELLEKMSAKEQKLNENGEEDKSRTEKNKESIFILNPLEIDQVRNQITLYLTHYTELTKNYLAQQTESVLSLKEFGQMVDDFITLSQDMFQKTSPLARISPSTVKAATKTQFIQEIQKCFQFMKSDSNLLVFNATQKFNQILDRLLPQIWQVVYLLKHLAQLTEEL